MTGTSSACARVRARLSIALDGGLAPFEAALDRGHFEACTGCRRERAEHRRLLAAIRTLSAPRVAELELVREAVWARLPERRRRTGSDSPWWIGATVAATAAAAWVGVLLVLDSVLALPHSVDLASLHEFLEQLPRWADVVRGLNALSLGLLSAIA